MGEPLSLGSAGGKMRYLLTIIFIIFPLFGEFSRTTGVIDIPKAAVLPDLGYRIGLDGSIALDSEHSVDDFDYNIHSALGIGDIFEGYLDIYTFKDFTATFGFSHLFYKKRNIALAWGLHQLSYSLDVSEVGHGDSVGWDDDLGYIGNGYTKPFELASAYLVSTYSPSPTIEFTIGLGRGRYVGYGPQSRYFNSDFYHEKGSDWAIGLILGLSYSPVKDFSILLDADGRDFNGGIKFLYRPIEIGMAITKIEHFKWEAYSPRFALSLSYLRTKERPKPVTIAGTVVDKDDGKPLAAEVGFLRKDIPKVFTKADLGTFKFTNLSAGTYELYAKADGYIGKKKRIRVPAGKTVYIDFELRKKVERPKTGDLIGRVIDYKTKKPVVAHLTLVELNKTVDTDATGIFAFGNLKPGIYKIKAEAEGYETGFYPGAVKAGEKTEVEIGMVKRGMVIHLRGIKFDFNKATIKPESYPILDEAAAILTSHPEIRVEIQGHTDSIGSDAYNLKLSNLRANAVRTYLIERHGIDPSRLVARGYGESRPIADNRTKEGRAQNRRVDFVILK